MKKMAICSVLALTGCATIFNGGSDNINLMTSNGKRVDAQVYSKSGMQQVTLPALINVPKSCSDITVQVVENDKIQQSTMVVSSGVNPWTFGNLIFGWLLGFAIDGATGNICTYDSSAVVPVYSK